MSAARSVAAVLLGLLAACAPRSVIEDANRGALEVVAGEVDQASLIGQVDALVQAHRADTKIDCALLHAGGGPLCNLSNQRARAVLEDGFAGLGLTVRRQDVTEGQFPTSNVIAELRGTTHPEEIVLIGAHYDAFWDGADDNSSGVAAMLEAARVLSNHRFARTVRFVGFDLEELGLVGSGRYADAVTGNERAVVALVLDGIGYFDSRPGSQHSQIGLPAPSEGDFLAMISDDGSSARAAEVYALSELLGLIKLVPVVAPRDGTFVLGNSLLKSDHTSFWLTGQQAVFLTDTAFLRNPHYHQETDTVDTLDAPMFRRAVQVSTVSLAYWAGGPL